MARLLPPFLMVMALGTLSLMDAFVKTLGGAYPVWQITFMRYAVGAAVVIPLLIYFRPALPDRKSLTVNMTRGVIMLVAAFCFFQAIQYLPLALATSLFFTAPLIIVVLGSIFLKEPITRRALGAIAIGSLGVLVICTGSFTIDTLAGDPDTMILGFALALVGVSCYAIAVVTIRARAQSDPPVMIILLQSVASAVAAAPFGFASWRPIAAVDWGMFVMIGLCGSAGFLALSHALKRAPVAKLAPFEYSAFIWASLWGFLFFSERPGVTTLIGAALIIAAGLMVIERKTDAPSVVTGDVEPR